MAKKVKLTKKQIQRLTLLRAYHKQMKQEGGKVDVERWTKLAENYVRDKKTRDRFLELLEVFAIDVDLVTLEELWFLDDIVEFIGASEEFDPTAIIGIPD